jgi:hypothetical protein
MVTKSTGRKWTPRLDERWEGYIRVLVVEKQLRSATQIQKRLKKWTKNEESSVYGLDVPNVRTIQKRLRLLVPDDGTGPWSMAEATEGEAEAVMPVLAAIAERAEGRVPTLSRGLAHLISCVRAAAPGLDAWMVYEVALAYWRRGDGPTEDLDLMLAFRPWRLPTAYRRFEKWVREHRPQWVGGHTTLVPREGGLEVSVPLIEGMWLAIEALAERTTDAVVNITEQEIKEGAPRAGAEARIIAQVKDLLGRTILVDTHTDNAEGGSESAAVGQKEGR